MINPNKNTQTAKILATMNVNLFKPFSALFCEEKTCAALPIPAIPSPFGECIRIKTINNNADMICVVQMKLTKIFSFLLRATFNKMSSF